jgi:hypothetical protein
MKITCDQCKTCEFCPANRWVRCNETERRAHLSILARAAWSLRLAHRPTTWDAAQMNTTV